MAQHPLDREGMVRFAHSDGPPGRRNIADLAAECEKVGGDALPAGGNASGTLYIKSSCGASRAAKLAVENLHQTGNVTIKNVTDDAAAKAEMVAAGGQDQAPCLVVDGHATYESDDIVSALVAKCAPLP
jgi:glutaredoxin